MRGATHTPSHGQRGATHPSTQRGSTDAPAQRERVLETGVDTWEVRMVKLGQNICTILISEVVRPQ